MDKQLEKEAMNEILKNKIERKNTLHKQVTLLESFLTGKITEANHKIDKESLQEIIHTLLIEPMEKQVTDFLETYDSKESNYYDKIMETVGLIFSSKIDHRRQIIYLENILKKIEQKEEDFSDILNSKDEKQETNDRKDINQLFQQLIQKIVVNYHLDPNEADEVLQIVTRYKDMSLQDIEIALSSKERENKNKITQIIEREMDERDLRDGRTKKQFDTDKQVIKQAVKTANKKLKELVSKNNELLKKHLEHDTTRMVDVIFSLLPEEYKQQRQLLEIILDTDIKERLGSLADQETKKIEKNLSEKNEDIIENQLYVEQRYKKIPVYEFDSSRIDKVYEEIIQEIRCAYGLPSDGVSAKKLNFRIKSEGNSTKEAFEKTFKNIKSEASSNLVSILNDLAQIRNRINLPTTKTESTKK